MLFFISLYHNMSLLCFLLISFISIMMDRSHWLSIRFVFHRPYDGQISLAFVRFVFHRPYDGQISLAFHWICLSSTLRWDDLTGFPLDLSFINLMMDRSYWLSIRFVLHRHFIWIFIILNWNKAVRMLAQYNLSPIT
jgi:hypothetical protein